MRTRRHRYMNPDLLDSQLVTLELPCDAWSVTVAGTPEEAAGEVLARLQKAGLLTTGVEVMTTPILSLEGKTAG